MRQEKARALPTNETRSYLVLVFLMILEDDSIDDPLVARAHEMDTHRNADFDPGSDRIFIENLTGTGHIGDSLAEGITGRAGALFQDDGVARRVLRNRAGIGRSRRSCRGLRGLSPGKRGDNCQSSD